MALSGLTLTSRNPWRALLVLLVSVICVAALFRIIDMVRADEARAQIAKGVQYQATLAPWRVEEVIQHPDSAWQIEQGELLSYGMTEQTYWFKIQLPVLSQQQDWLLELDYALIDQVSVWFTSKGEVLADYHTGDTLAFNQRPVEHEKFLFPLPDADTPQTLYVRATTSGAMKLPLYLWETSDFAVFNGEHNIVMGLFFGFIAAMALSNFFFFITSGSVSFLAYSGYVLGLGLTLACLHGLSYKYLWPDNQWLQGRSIAIFANLTMLCATLFTTYLLDVGKYSRLAERVLRYTAVFFILMMIAAMLVPYYLFIRVTLVCLIISVVYIYGIAFYLSFRGAKLARLYTLAWTTLLASGFIASLENLNLIDVNLNSHYLLMLGAIIETLLLAVVVAMNYNQQRAEKLVAQQQALIQETQLREARERVIAVQEEAQRELEYNVQERTLELEIALRELHEANRELEEKNTIDSLTGIRNRQYFDKRYLAEVRRSRREQTPLTVAMLDIDHFKQVNDQQGHLTGDACIRHTALLMKQLLKRPSDDICRYGGEEFAILLPNTDANGAHQLLEHMRQRLESSPVAVDDISVSITCSIGFCSQIASAGEPDNALLQQADEALYEAKRAGRNQTKMFQPKADSKE